MIKTITTNRGGLLKLAIYIILILTVLAYFGLNLRGIIASLTFQDNWKFVTGVALDVWNKYLGGMVGYLSSKVVVPLLSQVAKN